MAKIGTKVSAKAHKQHMEQEAIIERMAEAMRCAYLPYLVTPGALTLRMAEVLQEYRAFATKATNG